MLILRIEAHGLRTNEWNLLKLIYNQMLVEFLICWDFPGKIYDIVEIFNDIVTFNQKWASCPICGQNTYPVGQNAHPYMYLANHLIIKCTLQSSVRYGNSITWGQYARGRTLTHECWHLQMKRNRHGIKENNIISCKIIANSNYSKKNTNNRLASMALKLHKTDWKFDQAWLIDILLQYFQEQILERSQNVWRYQKVRLLRHIREKTRWAFYPDGPYAQHYPTIHMCMHVRYWLLCHYRLNTFFLWTGMVKMVADCLDIHVKFYFYSL